jgi:hypothetical protein
MVGQDRVVVPLGRSGLATGKWRERRDSNLRPPARPGKRSNPAEVRPRFEDKRFTLNPCKYWLLQDLLTVRGLHGIPNLAAIFGAEALPI